jgi:hypothetical protein
MPRGSFTWTALVLHENGTWEFAGGQTPYRDGVRQFLSTDAMNAAKVLYPEAAYIVILRAGKQWRPEVHMTDINRAGVRGHDYWIKHPMPKVNE